MAAASELKRAAGVSAMIGALGDFFAADGSAFLPDAVREFKAADDDISGGRFQVKTIRAIDFRAAEGFRRNGNRPSRRALLDDADGIGRGVNSIRKDDCCAGRGVFERLFEGGEGRYVDCFRVNASRSKTKR